MSYSNNYTCIDDNEYLACVALGELDGSRDVDDNDETLTQRMAISVRECPNHTRVEYLQDSVNLNWVVTYYQADGSVIIQYYPMHEYTINYLKAMWVAKCSEMCMTWLRNHPGR